jgi:hypothetical protein
MTEWPKHIFLKVKEKMCVYSIALGYDAVTVSFNRSNIEAFYFK